MIDSLLTYFLIDEALTWDDWYNSISNVMIDGLEMGQHVVFVGSDGICMMKVNVVIMIWITVWIEIRVTTNTRYWGGWI